MTDIEEVVSGQWSVVSKQPSAIDGQQMDTPLISNR